MKDDKKKLILTVVALVTLIVVVLGASYAYFVANVGSGSGANINATTGTTDSLRFNAGKKLIFMLQQKTLDKV